MGPLLLRCLGVVTLIASGLTAGCAKTSPKALAKANQTAAAQIAALPNGGSATWDDWVQLALLNSFDLDGSDRLDRVVEVNAIDCNTWRAMDASLAAGGEFEHLRRIYGFHEDFIWVDVLGIAEEMRKDVDDLARSCGLELE